MVAYAEHETYQKYFTILLNHIETFSNFEKFFNTRITSCEIKKYVLHQSIKEHQNLKF